MEHQRTLVEALDVTWQQCGTCWGQRVVLTPIPGDGYAALSCHHCIGIGERMTVTTPGDMPGGV